VRGAAFPKEHGVMSFVAIGTFLGVRAIGCPMTYVQAIQT